MVEGVPLETGYPAKSGIGGSNPSLSASLLNPPEKVSVSIGYFSKLSIICCIFLLINNAKFSCWCSLGKFYYFMRLLAKSL